jgi:hypothetical protein
MSKEGGSRGGFASAGRSMGGGLRGGVGFAERSGGSGFSSRGLSRFNGGERSVMSSVRTGGPSLARGSEKPSLSLGKADRPTLSFKGSSFESTKQTPAKNSGKFYTPEFRGTPLTPAAKAESKPASSSPGKIGVKSDPAVRRSGIEVASVMPQPSARRSLDRLQPYTPPTPRSEPGGLVRRANIDNAVPFRVNTGKAPEVRPSPRPELTTQRFVRPAALDAAATRPSVPKIDAKPTLNVAPLKDRLKKAEVKSSEAVVKDVPRRVLGKPGLTTEQTVVGRSLPDVKLGSKTVESSRVRTEPLSRLAYLEEDEEHDDDEERKEKRIHAATQMEKVAQAYVRAGLAQNLAEGMRMTERFLQKDPAILATNPKLAEKVHPSRVVAPIKVGALAEPSVRPETQTAVQLQTTTETVTQQKQKVIPTVKSEVKTATEVSTVAQAKAKVETRAAQSGATQVQVENGAIPVIDIITFPNSKQDEVEHDNKKKHPYKLDTEAQKNRIRQFETAVTQIFPAFDWESTAPLYAIAEVLERPNGSTTSDLIKKVGKNVDGSEIWRDALQGDTEVTKHQAIQIGLSEIVEHQPVALWKEGIDVKEEAVQEVLNDKRDEYALAA